MMEADIIQTDVLRWTEHHRGRIRTKEKKNTFILTAISNIGMMSPWLRFKSVVTSCWRDDPVVVAWALPVLVDHTTAGEAVRGLNLRETEYIVKWGALIQSSCKAVTNCWRPETFVFSVRGRNRSAGCPRVSQPQPLQDLSCSPTHSERPFPSPSICSVCSRKLENPHSHSPNPHPPTNRTKHLQ